MAVPHRAGRDRLAPEAYRLQFLAGKDSNSNVAFGAHSAPDVKRAVTDYHSNFEKQHVDFLEIRILVA